MASEKEQEEVENEEEEESPDPSEMVLALATFKPYTKLSALKQIEREGELKELEIKRAKHAQEAHLVDGELRFGFEESEKPPPSNPDLKEGCRLTKSLGGFPKRLLGQPIEEIDPGITDKTFLIIAKRFGKKYINRFSASNALFFLTPWNPIRMLMLRIITNQFFDLIIITTIVANCVFLAMPGSNVSEQIEYFFLAVYTIEYIFKVLARGFLLHKFSYLRDPWNWLDFSVIMTSYITIIVTLAFQTSLGNITGLRTFRVLRALKTVSIVPGLKTIVNALLRAFKMLFEVILLTLFCLMVFAMFGLQVYMGVLRQKCVKVDMSGYVENPSQSRDDYWNEIIRDKDNWYNPGEGYVVCGNASGSGNCPINYTCLGNIGENPRFGYLNFDHFGMALLSCFQLITLDFWEDIYNKIIRASGPWNVIYFIFVIFLGSFYLINLMLAVVSMSYEEEAVSAGNHNIIPARKGNKGQEKEKEKKDDARNKHNAMYEVAAIGVAAKRVTGSYNNDMNENRNANSNNSENANSNNSESASPTKTPLPPPPEIDSSLHKIVHTSTSTQNTIDTSGNSNNKKLKNGKVGNSDKNSSSNGAISLISDGLISLSDNNSNHNNSTQSPSHKQNEQTVTTTTDRTNIEALGHRRSNHRTSSTNNKDVIVTDVSSTADLNANANIENSIKAVGNQGGDMYEAKEGIIVIRADSLLDPEIGNLEGQLIDRNCNSCEKFCYCFIPFLKLQNFVYNIISDPLFDLFITLCIVLNTAFLSLQHYNQPMELDRTLTISNYVFIAVFLLEAILKIGGLGKYYFYTGWNIFDLIIVLASIFDMSLENVDGLTVLRTFRLLRVFKLAQAWPTMRLLLTIIVSTLGALGNLCVILIIVIYIFAVIGLQLFKEQYTALNREGRLRWHFMDFYHSMLMIFRVLCGEWIEPLYECMKAASELCMLVFLPSLVFGNFIVLNLFLALLLNAFASDSLDKHRETTQERSKFLQGFDRLKRIMCCCCTRFNGKVEPTNENDDQSSLTSRQKSTTASEDDKEHMEEVEEDMNISHKSPSKASIMSSRDTTPRRRVNGSIRRKTSESSDSEAFQTTERRVQFASFKSAIQNTNRSAHDNSNNNSKAGTKKDNSQEDIMSIHSDERSKDEIEEIIDEDDERKNEPPANCFPDWMRRRMNWPDEFNKSNYGQYWMKFRSIIKKVIDHKIFEFIVLVVILASSLTLAFEDVYLYQKKTLNEILHVLNIVFLALFTIEMVLKMTGMGMTLYFTNFWTILDFFIVCISFLSLIGDSVGLNNIQAFRSLRTLRALRPLRAISRWQGMKIVVNALMNAIPAIINVFMVCMIFWLIFSIMGVNFFGGKFFKCVNITTGEKIDLTDTVTSFGKQNCTSPDMIWQNSKVNFDNAGIGFLALFQVATFEGWMEVMYDAVDTTKIGDQPRFEANKYAYLYFVIFIVFGAFFSLNLFIGVIIDNFNVLKKKYEGSYLDAFLTTSQRNYFNTLKKLGKKKPQKTIKRPKNKFQLFFYTLAVSNKFELSIVLLIFLNMIVMAIDHYNQPQAITQGLEMMNIIFTSIFTMEAVVKIIGLRTHYFRFVWNIFDFIIVVISILGIVLAEVLKNVFVQPTLLRVIRVFRIGRVLRLIKAAKGIRKLLFALIISLPAIFNIGALLFLIMYMYSIIGMSSFMYVKVNGILDEISNFQTFGNAFMLLLRLATSAGWNDVLDALLISEPYCNPDQYQNPDGDWINNSSGQCGTPALAITFMVTYIIIVWLIIINMYIAVILENFNQAHEQEELGITEDDFDMFYVVWEKYDPHATQFIRYEQLADFVADLDQPLQLPKPNEIALVSFNLPIMEGEKMHCLDILIALVRNVLADVEESEEMNTLKEQMEAKFAQNFPSRVNITVKSSTLQRKKEDVAARTLQRAWRSFKAQKAMRNITALAVQAKIRRASAVGLRTRTDVMRNLGQRLTNALNRFFTTRRVSVTAQEFPSMTNLQESALSKQPIIGQHLKVPTVFTLYPEDKGRQPAIDL